WVAERTDGPLAAAGANALAKIAAVLPDDLRESLDATGLIIGPGAPLAAGDAELAAIRRAVRAERKLAIRSKGEDGRETARTIWPAALAFFDRVRVVVAWCELRQGFRHFRTDRIVALDPLETRYPRRRAALLKEWRVEQGIKT